MKRTISSASILAFVALGLTVASQAKAVEAPWSDYFGAHYEQRPWGGSVRDPGGPGRFGYRPPGSHVPPAKWADSGSPDELRPYLKEGPVVLNVGGLGSGRDVVQTENFLNSVRDDGGALWKRELSGRVRKVASIPGAMQRTYWQFGNEINGPRFLRNVVSWGGTAGRNRAAALQEFIPLYVEYFLAPGVEAVRAASQDVYGDPGRIHVMLGSLANARDPQSVKWYGELLAYTIKGNYAPGLAGKKVYEIVDTLSVHYLVSAEDQGWSDMLDLLARDWVGKGAVKAIWSTEEIGVRRAQAGWGAATALSVTARYLTWWSAKGWDASRGHCFFWGWDMGAPGTRADDALSTLLRFTGQSPLRPLKGARAADFESHLFSASGNDKRVLIALNRGIGGASPLGEVSVPAAGWTGQPKARVHLYTQKGERTLTASVSRRNGEYRVVFESPLSLAKGEALLILIDRD
jgi:hypothetical protein